jgi:proteic killer suppression protein
MIKTFKHKGLRAYFETGSTKGIQAVHAKRLTLVLGVLDNATGPEEIEMPGFRLHPLKEKSGRLLVLISQWKLACDLPFRRR